MALPRNIVFTMGFTKNEIGDLKPYEIRDIIKNHLQKMEE